MVAMGLPAPQDGSHLVQFEQEHPLQVLVELDLMLDVTVPKDAIRRSLSVITSYSIHYTKLYESVPGR